MGACEFTTYAFGKTLADAYDRACRSATHEYGHNGYNGTISTTSGCVESDMPTGWSSEEWHDMLFLINEASYSGNTITAVPPVRRKFAAEWERKSYIANRKLIAKFLKLDFHDQREMEKAARTADEKWGYAVGVELPSKEQRAKREANPHLKGKRGKFFMFTGTASM